MTKRERIALSKYIAKKIEQAEKYVDKYEKFKLDMVSDLDYICRTIVDDFYSDYMPKGSDPIYYVRKYDLYNAYKIIIDDDTWEVDEDWKYMHEHGKWNEYIYDLSFVRGYHGGAISGDGHPDPGIPYWRNPFPTFNNWGRPAAVSQSPYYRMEEEANRYFEKMDAEFEKTIMKPLEQIVFDVKQRVVSVI